MRTKLPNYQLLSSHVFSYFDTDGRYFQGGIPASEYIHEHRTQYGLVHDVARDYRTTATQTGSRITFLERRDLLSGQQPFRAYIYY